jgi:hypothetical protein
MILHFPLNQGNFFHGGREKVRIIKYCDILLFVVKIDRPKPKFRSICHNKMAWTVQIQAPSSWVRKQRSHGWDWRSNQPSLLDVIKHVRRPK